MTQHIVMCSTCSCLMTHHSRKVLFLLDAFAACLFGTLCLPNPLFAPPQRSSHPPDGLGFAAPTATPAPPRCGVEMRRENLCAMLVGSTWSCMGYVPKHTPHTPRSASWPPSCQEVVSLLSLHCSAIYLTGLKSITWMWEGVYWGCSSWY